VKLARWCGVLALAIVALRGAAVDAQPPRPYRILVTNDDGVRAAGIAALAEALKTVGEITIVAPAENQSAKSHSLTTADPIYADTVDLPGGLQATALTATPATCVKVAVLSLLSAKPDLVVSGINRGWNSGRTAYISGTVGAAREAALQGIPAIASSLDARAHPNYQAAAQATAQVAALVKNHGLDTGTFLNVNVPAGDSVKGLRLTRQSPLVGTERFVEQRTPSNRRFFWSVYQDATSDVEGTDVWAISQGYVAVTPLKAGEFDQKTFDAWQTVVK
jgi:5'/3'-nucleotidase